MVQTGGGCRGQLLEGAPLPCINRSEASASSLGSWLPEGKAWNSSPVDRGAGVPEEAEEWLAETARFHSRKRLFPSEKFPKQGPCGRSPGWVTWAIILSNSSLSFSLREMGEGVFIL